MTDKDRLIMIVARFTKDHVGYVRAYTEMPERIKLAKKIIKDCEKECTYKGDLK